VPYGFVFWRYRSPEPIVAFLNDSARELAAPSSPRASFRR